MVFSQKLKGEKESPKYALFVVSRGTPYFRGEPTTFLGWYADKEQITKEINDIQSAIVKGISVYELKYSAKVERHWLGRKIIWEY